MINQDIEESIHRIYNSDSKKEFKDIYVCYHSGLLRAAVTQIWILIVTDLVRKLTQMWFELKNNCHQNT